MAVDRNLIEEEGCLSHFYKIVLGWDYALLYKDSVENNENTADKKRLKKVKNTYKDVDDYLATYEPLLFEEVKAQILQRKYEEEEMDWKVDMVIQCHETDVFHFPEIVGEDWGSVSQNDLLLLSIKEPSLKKEFEISKHLPTYAFALVEQRLPDKIILRMRPLINHKKKTWNVMKICSLSTIAREYVAMRSISYLPYKDLILTAAANSIHSAEDQTWKIPKPLMEYIQTNHNSTQLEAIRAGLSRRKFVLIQGPPGTGKTQTILGLLSAILHATPHN